MIQVLQAVQTAGAEGIQVSLGETILFAILGLAAIALTFFGLLIARRPVYTIISVIITMVCLAFLYTMLEAPFMGVVQVVVYTGAILMMFLFVLMLIGVDSADSEHETLRGQRSIAAVGGVGVAAVLIGMLIATQDMPQRGLAMVNELGNPSGVAYTIFNDHVLTLELTGTLLIVAALGAMTLTHREKFLRRKSQEEISHQKVRDFTELGQHPGQKPNAGVYAEGNSSANPALGPEGQPIDESVNRVLRIRGQANTVGEISPATVERVTRGINVSGPSTFGKIGRATVAGMPGESAPDYAAAKARHDSVGAAKESPQLESEVTAEETEKEENNS